MKNEIVLRFCIWDFEDQTPDQITNLLQISPSKVFIKGERKNPKFAPIAEANSWFLNASAGKYAPFEDQMRWLVGIMEAKTEIFRSLSEKYYCEFSCAFYIYIGNGESTPSVHLEPYAIEFLNRLKVEFDIDILLLENKD